MWLWKRLELSAGTVEMMMARRAAVLLGLVLSGCSIPPGPGEPAVYTPPPPPTEQAIARDIALAAGEEKLTGPLEISAVRPTDHGPGLHYFCLKQTNPPADIRRTYFAVFANGEEYKGVRISVMIDDCEHQTYNPAPAVTPTTPPPAAQPSEHKKHHGAMQ
jgi:hypothetical protein